MMPFAFLATGLTLDDVRITTTTLMPLLDAAKSAFMMMLPYVLIIMGIKLAAWLGPIILSRISGNKSK